MGYSLAYSFDLSFTVLCTCTIGLLIKFLNGSRIILDAYIEDIKQESRSLNDLQKSELPNQTEIQEKFVEIIKFHSDTKQLSCKSESMPNYMRLKWFWIFLG